MSVGLAAAVRVGEQLARDVLWFEDRCNWISGDARPPDENGQMVFGTLGPAIYDGLAGVAWFFSHLYAATKISRFRRIARGAMRQALIAARAQPRGLALSLYRGALGTAVAAIDLSERVDDDAVHAGALQLLRQIRGSRIAASDLLSGMAGSIVGLLLLGDRELAIATGDRLIRRAQRPNLTGFSHGASGIGYALLELFAATGEPRFRRAAERAFDYERRARAPNAYADWCRGAPGMALPRLRAWEITGDERFAAEAQAAIASTRRAVLRAVERGEDGGCLCHGLAGNAAILHETSPDDRALVRSAARQLRGVDLTHVTLFLGSAGIGYLNLRLNDSRLPSILMPRPEAFARSRRAAADPESAAAVERARKSDRR
jgi:lantibiotic biosynthesis protein